MEKQPQKTFPDHIKDLLHPTPSGTAKLIAAWDGLSHETQIQVLSGLRNRSYPYYDLNKKIAERALNSKIPYIRYLAAKQLNLDDEEDELRKKIQEDPDPLVRYSTLETTFSISLGDDPEKFFELPQEARLAMVRCMTRGGREIAKLINYAIDNHLVKKGKVTELELFEILSDYLIKPEFKKAYEDSISFCYGEYLEEKEIEDLWNLTLNFPESIISYVLIDNLPGKGCGIPEKVLSGMAKHQLEQLLYRKDIPLDNIRKKIYFDENEKDLKLAASCWNFDFEYEEFGQILKKPEKEKVKILKGLIHANDLSLCFYDAIYDALWNSEMDLFGSAQEDAQFAKDSLNRRLDKLQGGHLDKQIRELRLYKLAKEFCPSEEKNDKNKDEENSYEYLPSNISIKLEFLDKEVVQGDSWATFTAFSKAWAEKSWGIKGLENYLPRLDELDEEYEDTYEDEDISEEEDLKNNFGESILELRENFDQKLSELISTLKYDGEDKDVALGKGLRDLGEFQRLFEEETSKQLVDLNTKILELANLQKRQKFWLFIIVALLVWIVLSIG